MFQQLLPDRAIRTRPSPSHRRNARSEEHTSELQSLRHLVCRLLLEKKKIDRLINKLNDDNQANDSLLYLIKHYNMLHVAKYHTHLFHSSSLHTELQQTTQYAYLTQN